MPTNLAIDDQLLTEALKLGGLRTKRETVNRALAEFVRQKKRLKALEKFGTIEFDPAWDYKAGAARTKDGGRDADVGPEPKRASHRTLIVLDTSILSLAFRRRVRPLPEPRCIAICDSNHGNPGLKGGAMLANEFIRLPYLYTKQRPPGAPSWGKAHKEFLRKYYTRSVSVKGPVQEMPVFDARVRVDPGVKDHWPIPVVRISGRRHPHDLEISRHIAGKAEAWLKESGAVGTWMQMPGMSRVPALIRPAPAAWETTPRPVTNRFGQVHDIDNLFIADGSLHVTNGGAGFGRPRSGGRGYCVLFNSEKEEWKHDVTRNLLVEPSGS